MRPITFEKTVPTDFRASNEIRNLRCKQIHVEVTTKDENSITLRAIAKSIPDIRYLFTRGYEKIPDKIEIKEHSDVVKTILRRTQRGPGGGIPLTRGEVAMLFMDGYAGDGPGLLDIRSQGYGDDSDWEGLDADVVFEDDDTVFVWSKWEPIELWPG